MTIDNPVFARFFDLVAGRAEQRYYAGLRDEFLAGLTGRVIEVGVGNGLNIPHYPVTVRELVAVEPEPYLRGKARDAAEASGVPVHVIDGIADRLPASDGEFDAAVVSGLLCSVDDPRAALAELRRVLRPGGELRFFEHVRSRDPIQAAYQDLFGRVWPALQGGCHPNRDTLDTIRTSGFTVESCRGFRIPPRHWLTPIAPRILGIARRQPWSARR